MQSKEEKIVGGTNLNTMLLIYAIVLFVLVNILGPVMTHLWYDWSLDFIRSLKPI